MQKYQSWDSEVAKNYVVTYGTPSHPKGAHKIRMQAAAHIIKFMDYSKHQLLMDIPCGVGHLYPFVKEHFDYLGIDASNPMLEIARNYFPEAKFIKGNIYDIEEWIAPELIVCLSLFIHLPEPLKILKKIYEITENKAIIGIEIGKREILRYKPRKEKFLIIRRETMKIVKGWLNELNIDNYKLEPIEGNTYYLVIEK